MPLWHSQGLAADQPDGVSKEIWHGIENVEQVTLECIDLFHNPNNPPK